MGRENVIINKYFGGLGNQMFQYAFGLNLEQQGNLVIADTSWYSTENYSGTGFKLDKAFPSVLLNRDEKKVKLFNESLLHRWIGIKMLNRLLPITRKNYIERKEFAFDIRALQTNKEAVTGYWQCHKYVDNVSEKLKKRFHFSQILSSELQNMAKKLSDESSSVFMHIRGGDYISSSGTIKLYGDICTPNYYRSAVALMKKRLHNPVFWLFTNDERYARHVLKGIENVNFISDYISKGYEDWVDLMMMSKCSHAIIANSSFSWWGAWLIGNPDKIVIAPHKWINKTGDLDIWEPEWIKI